MAQVAGKVAPEKALPASMPGSSPPQATPVFDARNTDLQKLVPIQVPHFLASSSVMQATGNDFILVLSQTLPLTTADGQFTNAAKNIPVAMVTMSPQSAKDLQILMLDTIKRYEADFGKIVTPYTRALEAQNNRSATMVSVKVANGKKTKRRS